MLRIATIRFSSMARCSFGTRASTVAAVTLLHGSTLDERQIKVEMDKGWYPGREFGRGETGAQVCASGAEASLAAKPSPHITGSLFPPITGPGRAAHGLRRGARRL